MVATGRSQTVAGMILSLPLVPLKGTVLYPGLTTTISAGRRKSVEAVKAAVDTEDKSLFIVAQRDSSVDQPGQPDIFTVGTHAAVRQMARAEDGLRVVLAGLGRAAIEVLEQTDPYTRARVRLLPTPTDTSTELEALQRAVLELGEQALRLVQPSVDLDVAQLVAQARDPLQLAYLLGSMLPLDVAKSQAILEADTRLAAMRLVHDYLRHEVQVLEVRQRIAGQAASEMSKAQRDYVLRQQLKAIQEELGERDPQQGEVEVLRQRLAEGDLPDHARQEAQRELTRLERLPAAAPDYQMTRSYLELLLELPWRRSTQDVLDLPRAREVLDADHFDVDEIKDLILENLAVMKLNPEANAPILCFVGPPGVGKTSMGQSIARAIGRKFERLSLGGMHDESELRGHRRTYIGAMPGRIIQAVRRAGVNNPVLMLDEVDKLGFGGFHGDPAAALLEILDPAQNSTFRDNYLDLPFDLSKVFFITTGNTTDTIPRALLDRMEVLRLSGYSREEKMQIARRYLIPRRVSGAGLSAEQVAITDEALMHVIARYTREAGVRQLERAIGRIARKLARRISEGQAGPFTVRPEDLGDLLGDERAMPEEVRPSLPPGVAAGMAWTEVGGEILYIEAALLPGSHGYRLTGSLGAVMKESASAARAYIWAHAGPLGIPPQRFRDNAVHLHVPSGAVPKDGPSAGLAMITALASLYTGIPTRADTAMTGEITLAGLVLPVGGIKEKVLAAHRAGIRRIILPKDNERDTRRIPEQARGELTIIPVAHIDEALKAALVEEPRAHEAAGGAGTAAADGRPLP